MKIVEQTPSKLVIQRWHQPNVIFLTICLGFLPIIPVILSLGFAFPKTATIVCQRNPLQQVDCVKRWTTDPNKPITITNVTASQLKIEDEVLPQYFWVRIDMIGDGKSTPIYNNFMAMSDLATMETIVQQIDTFIASQQPELVISRTLKDELKLTIVPSLLITLVFFVPVLCYGLVCPLWEEITCDRTQDRISRQVRSLLIPHHQHYALHDFSAIILKSQSTTTASNDQWFWLVIQFRSKASCQLLAGFFPEIQQTLQTIQTFLLS